MAETNVVKASVKTAKSNNKGPNNKGSSSGGSKVKRWFMSIGKYMKDSYYEVKKCSWPSWSELRQFTVVVIFALVVVAAWMAVINTVMAEITKAMLGGGYTP